MKKCERRERQNSRTRYWVVNLIVRSAVDVITYSKVCSGYNLLNIRKIKTTIKICSLSCQMSQFYCVYIFDPRHEYFRCPVYDYGWTESLIWPYFLLSINVQVIDRQTDKYYKPKNRERHSDYPASELSAFFSICPAEIETAVNLKRHNRFLL